MTGDVLSAKNTAEVGGIGERRGEEGGEFGAKEGRTRTRRQNGKKEFSA